MRSTGIDYSVPAIRFRSIILEIMNNEGINNSTESSSGSSQENDHSRVQSGEVEKERNDTATV